jgi:hypothetical protein
MKETTNVCLHDLTGESRETDGTLGLFNDALSST